MALSDNLLAYWKLDEASGNRADSVGGNVLTDVNTVVNAPGMQGNAASFVSANSEALLCADNVALSTGDINFTFACWVRPASLTGYPCVASKGWQSAAGPDREWIIYVDSAVNKLVFGVQGSAEGGVTSSVVLTANNWYFVVVWHDATGNQIGIQINNGTPNTVTHNTGVQDGTGAFRLGSSDPSHFLFWDGLIDEAGFWKRVLSATERSDLWSGGAGLTHPFSLTYFGYGPSTSFGMTLASLASSDTYSIASPPIDNSINRFVDALVQFRFRLVSGTPTGDQAVIFNCYSSEDGVNFPDDVPSGGGPFDIRAPQNLFLVTFSTTSNLPQKVIISVPEPPLQIMFDDFDSYTSGDLLGSKSGWQTVAGNASLLITAGEAGGNSSSPYFALCSSIPIYGGSYTENQYSEITWGTASTGTVYVGAAVSIVPGTSYGNKYYFDYYHSPPSGQQLRLAKMIDGADTTLVNTTGASVGFVTGDLARLERIGTGSLTRLTVKKNGTPIAGYTNIDPGAPYISGGVPGIYANGVGSLRIGAWRAGNDPGGTVGISQPISIAALFNGRMPRVWGIVIRNDTGLAFTPTESDHSASYTGLTLKT